MSNPKDKTDGEPRIGNPEKGVLLSPEHPNRIGFVCQRANPRVNEQGALEVCTSVVNFLNSSGASYGTPFRAPGQESGIDCVSTSTSGNLSFQVTRALRDPEFWRYLGENKGVMAYRERHELADDLWDAIKHKAARIPVADRKSITLVLDATDLFAHHSENTVSDFRARYGRTVEKFGFASVFVSSIHAMFVYRLA